MSPDRYGTPDEDVPAQLSRRDPYAIAHCELCDDNGMRRMHVCDHIDYAAIAARHMPAIRAMLKSKKAK